MSSLRILLLSAYDARSHQYWREGLVDHFPEHQWTVLTLPDHHFFWRIRSNSMTWAFGQQDTLCQDYDLMIVTSMVDLSSLRGFLPQLAQIPTIAYFHENQFAYPLQHPNLQFMALPQTINLYTALAADQIWFNSKYNEQSFLGGVHLLFRKMVDGIPEGLFETLAQKTAVFPVPLKPDCVVHPPKPIRAIPQIVWNHRWEYDKAPERFFAVLRKLKAEGLSFQLHVVGQSFSEAPKVFEEAKVEFQKETLTWGFVERTHYLDILSSADFVISTAIHDFQGIAMLEAAAAGCYPIVPNRLAYPELFPEACHYQSTPDSPSEETQACTQLIQQCQQYYSEHAPPPTDLSWLQWDSQKVKYQEGFTNLLVDFITEKK